MFLYFAELGCRTILRQSKIGLTNFWFLRTICTILYMKSNENYCSTDGPNVTQGCLRVTWRHNTSCFTWDSEILNHCTWILSFVIKPQKLNLSWQLSLVSHEYYKLISTMIECSTLTSTRTTHWNKTELICLFFIQLVFWPKCLTPI